MAPARRLGKPVFDLHGQNELLALTYSLGGLAVILAWFVDPAIIGNAVGMAVLLGSVFAAAAVLYGLRNHPPRYTGDVAILGSLVLIDVALFFTKLHSHPGLLGPFFVWVGFAAPLWFPRRRAILYVVLAFVASGIVIIVAGNASAVAGWLITTVTLVVAFFITSFLSDALVSRERLAIVGEMASVVGHDLRNPLGAVANSLFLLRHSLGSDITEKQDGYFQIAEREIAKASAILGDLRAYVHPGEPHIAPVDLAALVTEVFEVLPGQRRYRCDGRRPPSGDTGRRRSVGSDTDQPHKQCHGGHGREWCSAGRRLDRRPQRGHRGRRRWSRDRSAVSGTSL